MRQRASSTILDTGAAACALRGAGLQRPRLSADGSRRRNGPPSCLSLKVAIWATLASLPFGVLVALALARGRFWGKALLNVLVHLPLILPPVVTGYLLLLVLRPPGLDRRGCSSISASSSPSAGPARRSPARSWPSR